MIAFNLYGHRIVAERDSLNTYKKKAEKGEAKLQVINQTSPPPLPHLHHPSSANPKAPTEGFGYFKVIYLRDWKF